MKSRLDNTIPLLLRETLLNVLEQPQFDINVLNSHWTARRGCR